MKNIYIKKTTIILNVRVLTNDNVKCDRDYKCCCLDFKSFLQYGKSNGRRMASSFRTQQHQNEKI